MTNSFHKQFEHITYMDATWRSHIKQTVISALAPLNQHHAALRFNTFASERHLPKHVRFALWRAVLLRSTACAKNDASPIKGSMGPEQLCFCDQCVTIDCDSDNGCDRLPLAMLVAYPSYEWVPPPSTGDQEDRNAHERMIHEYMQRLGRLPRPLSANMCQEHLALLGEDGFDSITKLTSSSLTRRLILREIETNAAKTNVLLLILCGHGGKSGELVLADGSCVRLSEVAQTLQAARFSGTVVCALNACHAEPPLSEATACMDGWNAGLPFRWVLMYSCGSEMQKQSHALHFARLLGSLTVERPAYSELQRCAEELWVQTRDPGQSPSLWRGPPTICLGSCHYQGVFLGPAFGVSEVRGILNEQGV